MSQALLIVFMSFITIGDFLQVLAPGLREYLQLSASDFKNNNNKKVSNYPTNEL